MSVSHTTIQGAKIFAPCEAPLWHTSAITLSIEMVSHNAKQAPVSTRRPPTDLVLPTTKAKRPASRPPAKRAKFSGPREPSQPPQAEPPTKDSQIPVGVPLETIIRHPMIAGPPIEGNLDCRERSFHLETWLDIDALRQQPELRDSFHLLQRYHMEDLLTPRQFYYP
ncbi:hypothetical protein CK203_112243 [Vitis vinifera]|uniref:Uncharacterized protein n=1 Tax=Vitis vinifera TaxID=29760 RepID=A0A438BPD1_VITVI|nr:hypothetical protein CK203_112243 [Vitis vinifera]